MGKRTQVVMRRERKEREAARMCGHDDEEGEEKTSWESRLKGRHSEGKWFIIFNQHLRTPNNQRTGQPFYETFPPFLPEHIAPAKLFSRTLRLGLPLQ